MSEMANSKKVMSSDEVMFRSMSVNQNSSTPYSDATQVSLF